MSNEVATTTNFEVALCDLENTKKMCSMLMSTKHYSRMGEDGIFAIVSKAKALGVNPMDALNGGLYYVQGKVGMSAEMMAALIRQSGHSIVKDPKSDNNNCILHGKRADNGDTWSISFSMEDARRAGLAKNMYEKYPGVMLYNRAMSMLARQLFPDVIKGAGYTMDELREIAKIDQAQPIEAEVEVKVETITAEQATELLDLLSECPSDYRTKVMDSLKKLPKPIDKITELPLSLYDRLKLAAIKNKEAKIEAIEQTETSQVA